MGNDSGVSKTLGTLIRHAYRCRIETISRRRRYEIQFRPGPVRHVDLRSISRALLSRSIPRNLSRVDYRVIIIPRDRSNSPPTSASATAAVVAASHSNTRAIKGRNRSSILSRAPRSNALRYSISRCAVKSPPPPPPRSLSVLRSSPVSSQPYFLRFYKEVDYPPGSATRTCN